MNTTRALRHVNVKNCLQLLRDRGPMSRADLARELGTTRATVGYAVGELISAGYVTTAEIVADNSQKGRPGTAIMLNPTAAYFIGVEIAVDHLTVVLVNFVLKQMEMVRSTIDLKRNEVGEILDAVVTHTEALLARAKIAKKNVYGIAVSFGGIVTPDGRAFLPSAGTHWHGVPVAAFLEKRFPRKWVVRCCNNAAAVALAVAAKCDEKDKENLLVLLLATRGIGSAHVRKGVVEKGSHGMAGEIGTMYLGLRLSDADMTVQNSSGYTGIGKFLNYAANPVSPIVDPEGSDPEGDRFAEALNNWGELIATALLNAIYMVDPEVIVIAGPLAALYPQVQDRVYSALRSRILPGIEMPKISFSETNQQIAAIGAATLLQQELFLLPQFAEPVG